MSKHRHRDKQRENNTMNPNPFGIEPNQLMNMLGNMDMNNINNIISSMNQNGFDMNSLGNVNHMNQKNNSVMNGLDFNHINDTMKCANIDNIANIKVNTNEIDNRNDENLKLLFSLRDIVSEDRINFIDKIIDFYKKGMFKDK
ncbi:MAG: hypothetical protein ACRC7N_13085 [Clostridium sp.]